MASERDPDADVFMAADEHLHALRGAGFIDVRLVTSGDALALCDARTPAAGSPTRD